LLLNQETYRKLISGSTPGAVAAAGRLGLAAAAKVYTPVITVRNRLYSKRWLKIYTADAAVISVGNITVGGTGKTPLVVWLYNFLQQKNISCAILTRGYKTGRDKLSDEPAILAKNCPQAKIIVNPDRVAGAEKAVGQFGVQVLIMDDGFQHRRLARDLDIVAVDATLPFGYDKLLPAGLLREPVTAISRAHAVVITRTEQLPEYKISQLEQKLMSFNPNLILARSIHEVVCAKTIDKGTFTIDQIKEKKIFAFCGIGNPDAFFSTVKGCGLNVVETKIYDDHYCYTDKDVEQIIRQGEDAGADVILTTEKDWTKTALFAMHKEDITFAHLQIQLKICAGEDKLKQLIEDKISGKISQVPAG
jgi:tetraacyldisaccharide 4'-kinase